MTTSAELTGPIGSETLPVGGAQSPDRAGHAADVSRGNGQGRRAWTTADAAKLYGIQQWGSGYFSVNDDGHVAVHPTQDPAISVDLKKLVDELRERDIALPILLRFTDILRHRMGQLHGAFAKAIADHDYRGQYSCVYPIKVNQQKHVVEEVERFGREYGFGLEAGSKPELLAVLAVVQDDSTPIICNGFKDDEFIEAVILATKIGKNIIPVVEKFSELELIVKYAKQHNVQAEHRRAGEAERPRVGPVGAERRRPQQVRPVRVRDDRGAGVPASPRHGRLPEPAPLPPGQPDQQHPERSSRRSSSWCGCTWRCSGWGRG